MSFSRVFLIKSASDPSTNIPMAFDKNGFEISWPSSAIIPSFRAIVAYSLSCDINSCGFSSGFLKVFPATLIALRNSSKEHLSMTTIIDPPNTISIDPVSIYPESPAPLAIA